MPMAQSPLLGDPVPYGVWIFNPCLAAVPYRPEEATARGGIADRICRETPRIHPDGVDRCEPSHRVRKPANGTFHRFRPGFLMRASGRRDRIPLINASFPRDTF